MKEIINNSKSDLMTSQGLVKVGETIILENEKEIETCLKLGANLLENIRVSSKKSKKLDYQE